jgi:hypothetical protein
MGGVYARLVRGLDDEQLLLDEAEAAMRAEIAARSRR